MRVLIEDYESSWNIKCDSTDNIYEILKKLIKTMSIDEKTLFLESIKNGLYFSNTKISTIAPMKIPLKNIDGDMFAPDGTLILFTQRFITSQLK